MCRDLFEAIDPRPGAPARDRSGSSGRAPGTRTRGCRRLLAERARLDQSCTFNSRRSRDVPGCRLGHARRSTRCSPGGGNSNVPPVTVQSIAARRSLERGTTPIDKARWQRHEAGSSVSQAILTSARRLEREDVHEHAIHADDANREWQTDARGRLVVVEIDLDVCSTRDRAANRVTRERPRLRSKPTSSRGAVWRRSAMSAARPSSVSPPVTVIVG
jgi:hypothetical protein